MAEKKKKIRNKKNNEANWMISNCAKLNRRTKQHTQYLESLRVTVPEIWPGQNLGRKNEKKRKTNKANWMVSNSAQLDRRIK